MANNLAGFERDLDRFAESLSVGTETVVKKIALDVFAGVVRKTPVDKGRARASWVIGVERPADSPILPEDTVFSAAEAQRYAQRELAGLSELKPFDTVFVSNSLPYIEVLEDGSSRQAPNGMVAVTLREIERDIDRIADEF